MCLQLKWLALPLLVVFLAGGCSSPTPNAGPAPQKALVMQWTPDTNSAIVEPVTKSSTNVQHAVVVQPQTNTLATNHLTGKNEVATQTPTPVPVQVPQPAPPSNHQNHAYFSKSRSDSQDWVDMKQWCIQTSLAQLEPGHNNGSSRFILRSSRGNLELTSKSQTAKWKGMTFVLGFSPQTSHGRYYVHRLDVQNSILPLLERCDCARQTGKTLVIDPGHGGEPGSRTVVGGKTEKELTLDWALRIRALLTGHGWHVYLTRTNDVEVPLTNRVAFAEKMHADLFISLHFNSLPNSDQCGMETYCTTPAGMPSNLVRGPEELAPQPNNAFDPENLCWALQFQHELVKNTHAADRGVRRARFLAVLRTQKRPAILIEGGYLSNRKEATQIISAAYRQKLAEAVAQAILKK